MGFHKGVSGIKGDVPVSIAQVCNECGLPLPEGQRGLCGDCSDLPLIAFMDEVKPGADLTKLADLAAQQGIHVSWNPMIRMATNE